MALGHRNFEHVMLRPDQNNTLVIDSSRTCAVALAAPPNIAASDVAHLEETMTNVDVWENMAL